MAAAFQGDEISYAPTARRKAAPRTGPQAGYDQWLANEQALTPPYEPPAAAPAPSRAYQPPVAAQVPTKAYQPPLGGGGAGTGLGESGVAGAPPPAAGNLQAQVQALLNRTGANASPQALASLEGELAKLGVTLQKSSSGEIRGRLYLPGGQQIDVVPPYTWGAPWQWIDRGMMGPPSAGGGGGGGGFQAPSFQAPPFVPVPAPTPVPQTPLGGVATQGPPLTDGPVPIGPIGGVATEGPPLTDGPVPTGPATTPTSITQAQRDMLLRLMDPSYITPDLNDPALKQRTDVYRAEAERTRRSRRDAELEALGARGLGTSGAGDASLASGYDDMGRAVAGYAGDAIYQEQVARRGEMMQALALATQMGMADEANALRWQIAQLDAELIRSGQNLQNTQFYAGLGQQNQQFNTGLGQQNAQFNANLGQQNAQFNAGLGQQNAQFNAGLGQHQNQFNQNLGWQQYQYGNLSPWQYYQLALNG